MARPLKPSTIRHKVQPDVVCNNKAPKAPPPPPPPAVVPGQTVYLSVLPKTDLAGNGFDASPKVFATEAAAQADCDDLNKGRHPSSRFVVRKMEVH